MAQKLNKLDHQISGLAKRTGGTPGALPTYDHLTEEKGERLLKAREARLALLRKKADEQEGKEEEQWRSQEQEDLEALEEQQVEEGVDLRTEFVEEAQDDEEEAEAERAMAEYLANRAKAKAEQTET